MMNHKTESAIKEVLAHNLPLFLCAEAIRLIPAPQLGEVSQPERRYSHKPPVAAQPFVEAQL
jgi:hypothetical protein